MQPSDRPKDRPKDRPGDYPASPEPEGKGQGRQIATRADIENLLAHTRREQAKDRAAGSGKNRSERMKAARALRKRVADEEKYTLEGRIMKITLLEPSTADLESVILPKTGLRQEAALLAVCAADTKGKRFFGPEVREATREAKLFLEREAKHFTGLRKRLRQFCREARKAHEFSQKWRIERHYAEEPGEFKLIDVLTGKPLVLE